MNITIRKRLVRAGLITAAGALVAIAAPTAWAHGHNRNHSSTPFISTFTTVTPGAVSAPAAGPEAGDQNPYGVAVVPRTVGNLVQGNILVSNFNNVGAPPTGNLQGTGSSIVQYTPDVSSQTTFTEIDASTLPDGGCPGGVGLTTALVALRSGWVIVGSLPTKDGSIGTVGAGCLIVLDAKGNPVEVFSGGNINGPWDMTARDGGFIAQLFFTNVLNGGVASAAAGYGGACRYGSADDVNHTAAGIRETHSDRTDRHWFRIPRRERSGSVDHRPDRPRLWPRRSERAGSK